MNAETLRKAAALMRERATDAYSAVDDGDWRFENLGWDDVHGTTYTVENDTMKVCAAVIEEPAVHIASWHPAVAFAVANWLDYQAKTIDHNVSEGARPPGCHPTHPAFAVARAYLGETA